MPRLAEEVRLVGGSDVDQVAARTDLHLDLEHAETLDVTVMQLLWAAGREPEQFRGAYAEIVRGVNAILDAVIRPASRASFKSAADVMVNSPSSRMSE